MQSGQLADRAGRPAKAAARPSQHPRRGVLRYRRTTHPAITARNYADPTDHREPAHYAAEWNGRGLPAATGGANIHSLSFEERLGLLIDRQWNWRQNRALERLLRHGRLQGPACVEDIDYRTSRGLDRQLVRSLTAESAWVREHQHLLLVGPTGIGKTWLARAFAQKACRDGYTALFMKAAELFREFVTARADGSHPKLLDRLGRVDLLFVDDWAMAPMSEIERRDFLEICDSRYQTRSTLLTSQLPVATWHAQIGDPTIADNILYRLVHNAHRIEMQGESMRKKRGGKNAKEA